MGRKGFDLDYAALLEETVSLMEERTLALTPASEEVGERAAKKRRLPEGTGESVARNIRRRYRSKYGASRKRGARVGASAVYPGLGVLYDVLDHYLPIINRSFGAPLSPAQRQDAEAVCEEIALRLRARLEDLDADEQDELERQVQRDVIDLHAMINPTELIARERKRVQELLDKLRDILTVKDY